MKGSDLSVLIKTGAFLAFLYTSILIYYRLCTENNNVPLFFWQNEWSDWNA